MSLQLFAYRTLIVGISFFLFGGISGYSQNCTNERVFVHTDRNSYIAGETVWFKAYVYSKFTPDDISTVLITDLVDQHNRLISSHSFPIADGVALGNIEINTALPEGGYLLKVYIKKDNPAADSSYPFVKPLYILNLDHQLTDAIVDSIAKTGFQCTLYPNSGKLVAGVKNNVFFRTTNAFDAPVDATGEILDAKHDTIASFTTSWNGLGRFAFIPGKGEKYTAVVHFRNTVIKTYALGDVITDKVTVDVSKNARSAIFQVLVPLEMQTGQKATAYGIIDGNIVFRKEWMLAKDEYTAEIPTAVLPTSVMDIIVTGSDKKIVGYRSMFINGKNAFAPVQLHTDSLDLHPAGRNVFTLQVPDSMMGNVSVSVTDYDQEMHKPEAGILSALLLKHENKEQSITMPFLSKIDDADNKIDLLLATSDYMERAVYPIENTNCVTPDTNFLSITGNVTYKGSGKPVVKGDIRFVFTNQDSGISIMMAPVDKNGRFRISKLLFRGKGNFKYALNSKSSEIIVHLDSIPWYSPQIREKNDFLAFYGAFHADTVFKKSIISRYKEINETGAAHTTLAAVTVTKKIGRPIDRVTQKYARGLFQSTVFGHSYDFINDPPPPIGGNILDYLQGKVNGLLITYLGAGGYSLGTTRVTAISNYNANNPAVRVYINEQETTVGFLIGIALSDVALVKFYPAGNSPLPGTGMSALLVIYTRKWDDYPETAKPELSSFSIKGFSNTKDFNEDVLNKPTPANAKRATLYWNPMVLLDYQQRSFTFRFANTAGCRRFYVKVQGFTPDGKLIYLEKLIE